MEYKHILVGFDGSAYSKKALETAEHMAKKYDAKLFVVYVDEPSAVKGSSMVSTESNTSFVEQPIYNVSSFTNTDQPIMEQHSKMNVDERANDEEVLTPLHDARNILSERVDVEYVHLTGNPTTAMIKFAKYNHVDVIVVGKSGVTGMEQLFIGSVSKNIVKKAECSVIVVK
ncbi:MAG TPA: universal stress protein [Virgibacillus sp.]|nr:universal stress protein [Virgibacillus sp.]HLR67985.1 universal stress protein [Virgibacillus sp.]